MHVLLTRASLLALSKSSFLYFAPISYAVFPPPPPVPSSICKYFQNVRCWINRLVFHLRRSLSHRIHINEGFFASFLCFIDLVERLRETLGKVTVKVHYSSKPQFPTDGFQNGGCFSEIAICLELSRGFCRERICHKYSSSG